MAIPSRQIGGSTTTNLLWQISKQLERLICVRAGGCPTTTTTSTIASTTTTTTTCVEFINSIIISNGSYASANGTYTRDNPSGSFTLTEGDGSIFFGGDAWYIFNSTIGNVARNTSTLGTGTWEPWAPGNSSGITAEYFYYTCPTTTTTTTVLSTNYNVAGCERMEYHVITYTGEGELLDGTIVSNATPECWFIIDQTTDPADVGTIDTVYGEGSRCETCIDSHTTTTTTTAVPVRINLASFGLGTPCTPHIPPTPITAFTSAACLAAITVGCIMYADDRGTLLSQGYYEYAGGYFYVNNEGEIVNINTCPQP